MAFGKKLEKVLLNVDKAIKLAGKESTRPSWVNNPEFYLPGESDKRKTLLRLEAEIKKIDGDL